MDRSHSVRERNRFLLTGAVQNGSGRNLTFKSQCKVSLDKKKKKTVMVGMPSYFWCLEWCISWFYSAGIETGEIVKSIRLDELLYKDECYLSFYR